MSAHRLPPHSDVGAASARHGRRGLTMIELMATVALIAVLTAVALPTLSRVHTTADRARTQAQFAQWGAAFELFRQEYGFYPDVTAAPGVSGVIEPSRLLGALTARDHLGQAVSPTALAGNRRALRFVTLGPESLVAGEHGEPRPELLDAFGNSEIVVLIDADQDGLIAGPELVRLAPRRGNSVIGFESVGAPPDEAFPASGLRASVAFYSAGAGQHVFSWQ